MTGVAAGLSGLKGVPSEIAGKRKPRIASWNRDDPGSLYKTDWRETLPGTARLLGNNRSGRWIENELSSFRAIVEVEHPVQRASNRIRGTITDTAKIPIVFDEAKDGRL